MLHRRQSNRARAFALATAVIANVPFYVHAQTSGTWTFNGSGNWSDASKWSAGVPNGGGVATITNLPYQALPQTITLDVPTTLDTIHFDSAFQYVIGKAAAPNALTLSGNATIDALNGPMPSGSPTNSGYRIATPIAGSAGLKKTGGGWVALSATNTYTGGTQILGGTLAVTSGDSALGATGAGNDVTIDNGTLYVDIGGLNTARNFSIGANGGTFAGNGASVIFAGTVSGSGTLSSNECDLWFRAPSTYLGATSLRGADLKLSLAGSILNTASITAEDVVLDNTGAVANNVLNRLPSVPMRLSGGSLQMLGNANATSSETVGAVTTDAGATRFLITPGTGQNGQLTLAQWTRTNRSSAIFLGTGLGATPGANTSNIFLTTAPTLVGGGGAAGTTNISIIPGAVGSDVNFGSGVSLVTYGPTGVRPLATTEYATSIAAANPTDNVRVTATEVVDASKVVNSLVIATAAGPTGSGTITVTSGMVMQTATFASGNTFGLEFGTAEGVISCDRLGSLTGVINGSNGVTKTGFASITFGNSNTYTGDTTILSGDVIVTGNVGVGTPSAFGKSNDPVVLNPGGFSASALRFPSFRTFARKLIARGTGVALLDVPGGVTINGPIELQDNDLYVDGLNLSAVTHLDGVISGTGGVRQFNDASTISLSGNNTYSGGTKLDIGGVFLGAHDNAFGTGSITISSSAGPTIGSDSSAHTFANPIFATTNFSIWGNFPTTFSGPVDLGSRTPITITVFSNGPLTFTGEVKNGGLVKAGAGRMRFDGTNTYHGDTTVNAGTLVFGATESNSNLILNGTARADLAAGGGKTLVIRSLDIAGGATPTATLDLFNNDLKVANTTYDAVAQKIAYANNFGSWNRAGITSSSARTNPTANTTLGVLTGDEYLNSNGSPTFNGFAVSGTDVLVKYTYFGDVDFNGSIDASDYNLIDFGFVNHLSGWANGDTDYSGGVDASDYNLIDFAFVTQNGVVLRAIQYLDGTDRSLAGMDDPSLQKVVEHAAQFGGVYSNAFLAQVPEPASVSLMALATAAGALGRRKRRERLSFPHDRNSKARQQ